MAADRDPRDGDDAGGRLSARRGAAGPGRRRVDPALPGSARHRLIHGERRLPGVGRRGRQHRHPLVQRLLRPAVAAGRSGRDRLDHLGHPAVGSGVRDGVPDPDVVRRHELDHDLLHDHRNRRHADPQRDRHRPVRPDVRHGARHPVRLLAVGIPGLRQPEQRQHLRHHGRRPQPARHRLLDRERRHARGGRGRRQHRHPLVQRVQRSRSGCRWTSGPARRSAGSR